ncbi:MAG: hypothetical protein KJO82_04050, partial [Gammaproteobacteria bacterium]|nr:hypothetical protein [Gammaproteobacteria bacterium]
MSLPASVIEYLQSDFVSESRPFCLQLDASHRLIESSGDGEWSGLANLEPGTDMLEQAPFLYGALSDQPQKLNYVSTGDIVMHLLTIPYDGGHYVVMLDAGQSHDFLQQRQQSANEMRLLHASQQRLITRQRDLIT